MSVDRGEESHRMYGARRGRAGQEVERLRIRKLGCVKGKAGG